MAVIASGIASVAESGPGSVAPPDRMLKKDLARLDDRALLGIVRLLPQASGRRAAACELLVTRHQGLVWSCVRRYLSGPEPAEDLMQVGYVGLLKAISNFDPAAGAQPGYVRAAVHQRRAQAAFPRQTLADPCQAPGAGTGPGSP